MGQLADRRPGPYRVRDQDLIAPRERPCPSGRCLFPLLRFARHTGAHNDRPVWRAMAGTAAQGTSRHRCRVAPSGAAARRSKSPMTPNFRATWRSNQPESSAWILCHIGGTRSGAGSRLPSSTSFSEPAPHFRPGVVPGCRSTVARGLSPSPPNAPCSLGVVRPSDRHRSLRSRRASALLRFGPGRSRSAFPGY